MEDTPPKIVNLFLSAFAESVHGRCIGVPQGKASEILVGYTVLFRRFQRALKRALASIEAYEIRRLAEGWANESKGNATDHLYDLLEAIYVAAELFEFYESDIVRFIDPAPKAKADYKGAIKSLKRLPVIICNRCKHNHAYLQSIEIVYDNANITTGFALYRMKDETASIDLEVHREREAFSFNWICRKLLGGLLMADAEVGKLISSMPEMGAIKLRSINYTLPIYEEFKAISERGTSGMPKEKRLPRLSLDQTGHMNVDNSACDISRSGTGKMAAVIDLISSSLAIELPYVQGSLTVSLTADDENSPPLAAFMRVVVGGVTVEDE
ncbi:hypothetical protein [Sphingomonas faeni]|uniref:hypothetical protein n=1 Tax=Sphingomonas faeni TaxID=185950 RepID=UPI00277F7CF6|nr:hypothetical protein [Sphingomonas faeni]MDQ0840216.1 hypothetical protein [Sphingomonas faeni]